ncbi:MAG: MFS transporter [Planctomycetota bacterium]|nr:MFS transporter [Planctomycetota bacterium]
MRKRLFLLLTCLFVVMIGYGITMPVLPFYSERLALAGGASRRSLPIHIALLTSIYALAQFIFAPVWGRWSDRIGRRRLLLIGIAGSAVAMILFGVSTSLRMLYIARIIGGILSSATVPAAAAYVADVTDAATRSRGMAWLGSSVSLGVIAGLALGGISPKSDLHFIGFYGCIMVSSLSFPFFGAAILMAVALLAALRWLPESLPAPIAVIPIDRRIDSSSMIWRRLGLLLGVAAAGQFGLTIFEGTFAVYAQQKMGYGPSGLAITFMVCGSVMAVFQVVLAWWLSGRLSELSQLSWGFALMGVGITLLLLARSVPAVLGMVATLAMGMALISPNLSALISRWGGERTGAALGLQSAANSLGQAGGPIVGSLLFVWRSSAPYALAGFLMFGIGIATFRANMAWPPIGESSKKFASKSVG